MTAIAQELVAFPGALERAQAGDQDAFRELVERHQSMVYGLAWNFFADRGRAEEVAQEVFLQLYRSLRSVQSDAHLVFWLRQVATRRCIDEARRSRIRVVALDDAEIAVTAETPDPLLDRKVRQFVGELSEVQRAVLTLRYQEELEPAEICRIVGIPLNTVKSHLHRALCALRKKLETI